MKIANVVGLLSLIMLTQLDGNPVFVEHSAIVIVKPSHTGKNPARQCPANAGVAIRAGGIGFCLKETVDQLCAKIEKAGGKCER